MLSTTSSSLKGRRSQTLPIAWLSRLEGSPIWGLATVILTSDTRDETIVDGSFAAGISSF